MQMRGCIRSVYPDIDAALSNRLRANLGQVAGPLFTPLLTPTFKLLLPPIICAAPSELRPIDKIRKVNTLLLIASGTADAYTPLDEAKALFDQASVPKQFWGVDGAGHVDLEAYNSTQYWSVVLPFLNRYMKHPVNGTSAP
jgi:uncharacterized protein